MVDISKAMEEILNTENILAQWSVICNGNLEVDESDMLLAKIAELWLTLRGFFYTSNLRLVYRRNLNLKLRQELRNNYLYV